MRALVVRRLLAPVAVILVAAIGCQPITHADLDRGITTCEAAIGWVFIDQPVSVRDRFNRIVHRESRHNPRARNSSSSATGCTQILTYTHRRRIAAMGYTAADMLRPYPNLRVARSLWDEAGWQPWRLTA